MRMNLGTLAYVALIVLASGSAIAQEPAPKPLLIRDVTVIDCAGHEAQQNMSVLISNGFIVAIGPASKIKATQDTEVLDGHGKYLIPGLWNMHVHLRAYADGKRNLSAFLDQGVVGVRDMGSPLEDILRLRQETNDGTILGPRMMVAGPIIQGPLPFQMPVFLSVKDPAEGRQTVQMLKNRGVDFIKVQDAIPHDIYVAIADQARLEHIPFVGHVPPTVLAEEASDLGQRSIEHLGGRFWGVLIGASTRESELHAEEVQMYQDLLAALERKEPPSDPNMRSEFTRKVLESHDGRKATALIARFRKNNTWECPTLVVLHTLWTGPETKYTSEDLSWGDRIIAKDAELVAMMQKAGVGLLAGTDLPPNAKNGTIHDELADLVGAGLTPLQALQTATSGPANFLGKIATSGTVEKGKVADLVLLNANPLDDIHNTSHISAVIVRGRLLPYPHEVIIDPIRPVKWTSGNQELGNSQFPMRSVIP
jgi:imidazolonepropionase-like amidohydrolase